jgi:hypothetical protein
MTKIIQQILLNNPDKKLKIILMNDYIYHGFLIEADEEFISIRLDNSQSIKIIRIDAIKEVLVPDAS